MEGRFNGGFFLCYDFGRLIFIEAYFRNPTVVFKGWNWILLTVSQSQRFSRAELILFTRTVASVLEPNIWESSAYKQGEVNSKQFGKSFT